MELKPLDGVINIFYGQIIAALLALTLVLIFAPKASVSFLSGECAMLIANGFLAWRVYRQRKTMQAMSLVLSFLGGEVGKYVLIILSTVLFAKLLTLNWLFYIIGLGVPQLGGVIIYWMRKS